MATITVTYSNPVGEIVKDEYEEDETTIQIGTYEGGQLAIVDMERDLTLAIYHPNSWYKAERED